MNTAERLELAHWAAKQARKSGADEAAVNVLNVREIEIQHRERKLERLKEATQNALTLTIYADQRYSSNSTNDMRRAALERFISESVAMTKYLSEDPYRSLPDPKYYLGQKHTDLHLLDPGYENLTSDERVRLAREIEEAMLAESDRIITCTAHSGDTHLQSVKVHTNGFEGTRHTTAFYLGSEASVRDEGDARPSDWEWCTVRSLKELPKTVAVGKGAVKRALRKLGQRPIRTGIYDMIIDNRTAGRLLSSLRYPMTAAAIQQKNSFLEGKLGEQVFSTKLTIIDDPFINKGLGSRLFDSEGMASKRRLIVSEGIIKSYYVDTYYGKKLGWVPTTGQTSNITYDYGTRSLAEMVKDMSRGILVTGFIGGNSNSTTGDFSFGISGQYIENGEEVHPVKEMNISGNLMELMQQLAEVGNDPFDYSSHRRPSLYFKDVHFSGV